MDEDVYGENSHPSGFLWNLEKATFKNLNYLHYEGLMVFHLLFIIETVQLVF